MTAEPPGDAAVEPAGVAVAPCAPESGLLEVSVSAIVS